MVADYFADSTTCTSYGTRKKAFLLCGLGGAAGQVKKLGPGKGNFMDTIDSS